MCFPDEGSQSLPVHLKELSWDLGLQVPFALQPSPAHPSGLEKSHWQKGVNSAVLPGILVVMSARRGPLLLSFTEQIFLEHLLCMCQALF